MKRIAPCAFALIVIAASAHAATEGARAADAHSPDAPVPPSPYRSAFETYKAYADPSVENWRALNEQVGRVGGHIGILRQANEGGKAGADIPGQAPPRGAPAAPGTPTHVHRP